MFLDRSVLVLAAVVGYIGETCFREEICVFAVHAAATLEGISYIVFGHFLFIAVFRSERLICIPMFLTQPHICVQQ